MPFNRISSKCLVICSLTPAQHNLVCAAWLLSCNGILEAQHLSLAQTLFPESWDRKRKESLEQCFQLSIHTGTPSISYSNLKKVYIAMERNARENFTCLLWLYSVLLILCLQCRACTIVSVNQLRTNFKKHHKTGRQMLKNLTLD